MHLVTMRAPAQQDVVMLLTTSGKVLHVLTVWELQVSG